jgi:hypothetical protein
MGLLSELCFCGSAAQAVWAGRPLSSVVPPLRPHAFRVRNLALTRNHVQGLSPLPLTKS